LLDLLHIDLIYHSRFKGTVASAIGHGAWDVPPKVLAELEVATRITSIILPVSLLLDKLAWAHSSDGLLTANQASSFLRPLVVPLQRDGLI